MMPHLQYFTGTWEEDMKLLEKQLEKIEFKTPTSRRLKFNRPWPSEGSVLYGYTWRSYISKHKQRKLDEEAGRYETTLKTQFPELQKMFEELRNIYFEDFKFTGVQLNRNYRILPHKDTANIGESVLISCGDYKGGRTIVEINGVPRYYDSRERPVKFDGSQYRHWVEPFEGTRYSCVFFNDNKAKRGLHVKFLEPIHENEDHHQLIRLDQ